MCIVIPKSPILSVVDGACRFSLVPKYIHARVMTKTYGIKTRLNISEAKERGLTEKEINERAVTNKFWNVQEVRNCFHIFVRRDDMVKVSTSYTRTYCVTDKLQKYVGFEIYESNKTDPKFIDDDPINTCVLSKSTLHIPDWFDRVRGRILVTFHFSETVTRITAMFVHNDEQNKGPKTEKEQQEHGRNSQSQHVFVIEMDGDERDKPKQEKDKNKSGKKKKKKKSNADVKASAKKTSTSSSDSNNDNDKAHSRKKHDSCSIM